MMYGKLLGGIEEELLCTTRISPFNCVSASLLMAGGSIVIGETQNNPLRWSGWRVRDEWDGVAKRTIVDEWISLREAPFK
jgi:hypothetical protein